MNIIRSTHNPTIQKLRSLTRKKQREASGVCLVGGQHLIHEAFRAGLVRELFIREDLAVPHAFSELPCTGLSTAVCATLTQTESDQSLFALVSLPSQKRMGNRVLMLADVQDPGNVGTLIRSALSFGFTDVVLSSGCADVSNDKVIRASQGAVFHINMIRQDLFETISALHQKGLSVYTTDVRNGVPPETLSFSEGGILLGSEGSGVPESLAQLCDARISLPMKSFESLNVAVAGSIILYLYRLI